MLKRFLDRVHQSFRYKLLLLVFLPILVFFPLILTFILQRTYSFAEEQLSRRVHTDINVASASFKRQENKYLQAITQLAESHAFFTAMRQSNKQRLKNQLQVLKVTEGLDFVHVVNTKGKWLFDDTVFSGEVKPSPLIQDVVHSGLPRVGLELYTSAYLTRERHGLAEDARITSQQTTADKQISDTEHRALVMRAVYPIKNERGQTVALLEGGLLLNDNTKLVNAIHELVYGPGSLPEGGNGLISIVLDDMRIATNLTVQSQNRVQVLGSTVPPEVRQAVFKQDKSWVGKVTTPDGVYLSAYQPLRDYQNNVIGMLEAGYLVAPLRQTYLQDLLLFGMLLLSLVFFTAVLTILGARRIFKPIERIAEVIHAQEAGKDLRIGNIKSRDEIGAVAERFDRMLDLLHERNAQIQRSADYLEQQVYERTRELRLKNNRLENTIELLNKTRKQLVMSEKFAALGELTAGVAHEINNPTAVILGNMDLVIEELGEKTSPVSKEISLIYEQVYRIRNIVERLLKYSRASPSTLNLQMTDVNRLIEDTTLLVRHEAERKQADIVMHFAENCRVRIDAQELQQVLINLLINAIHAIDQNGKIEISTHELKGGDVSILIHDDGEGIDSDDIVKIFDPFYSTKKSQGTGLGLSVSYGLVNRYGGSLDVSSMPGEGTVFCVQLLHEPKMSPQMHAMFELYSHEAAIKGEVYYE